MDTTKYTKPILQEDQEKKASEQEKSIYEIINSKELEILYKKNAHLLARLSKTGKENTQLYTKLSSLSKEKSYLDNKNTVLKNKFLNLKDQISVFARQHRAFNEQSRLLKKALETAKKIPVQENIETLPNQNILKIQERSIKLLNKKEQVYRKQIENLQVLYKREKQDIQKEYKHNTQKLEEKIQELHQALTKEQNKTSPISPEKLKELEDINHDLNQKYKELSGELKKTSKANQSFLEKQILLKKENEILKKNQEFKVNKINTLIEEKEKQMAQAAKDLKITKKENNGLKRFVKEQFFFKQKNEELKKDYDIQIKNLNSVIKEKEKQMAQAAKDLKIEQKEKKEQAALMEKNLKAIQKENDSFKKQEEKIKREKKIIIEENKKITAFQKEFQKYEEYQKNLLNHKNQIDELNKQKQQLKSDFSGQLQFITKEKEALKSQCENLKRVLSSGKLGFDQAILSFQNKYAALYQNHKKSQKALEEKISHIQTLEKNISQFKTQSLQEKENIKKEKERHINELCGELNAVKEHNRDMEKQIQKLQAKENHPFLKEKKQLEEEIKRLRWDKDKNIMLIKEHNIKEIENLKSDYEKRINKLSDSFQKKLRHIRIEMENDLCSEKKRYETFKNIKGQQIKDTQNNLTLLQKENQELKTKQFVLEKSLEESQTNINKQLKSNKNLEDQNESLKTLWQDLQKKTETQEQQIHSLQKLNKSLSLLLNQYKKKKQVLEKLQNKDKGGSDKKELKENAPETPNHILADLHFD